MNMPYLWTRNHGRFINTSFFYKANNVEIKQSTLVALKHKKSIGMTFQRKGGWLLKEPLSWRALR